MNWFDITLLKALSLFGVTTLFCLRVQNEHQSDAAKINQHLLKWERANQHYVRLNICLEINYVLSSYQS